MVFLTSEFSCPHMPPFGVWNYTAGRFRLNAPGPFQLARPRRCDQLCRANKVLNPCHCLDSRVRAQRKAFIYQIKSTARKSQGIIQAHLSTPIPLRFTKFLADGKWWTSWFLQSLGSVRGEIHLSRFIPPAMTKQLSVELEGFQLLSGTVSRIQGFGLVGLFSFRILLSSLLHEIY